MRPIIARETSLSAMCGRLRVGKDFLYARRLRSNDEWSPVCYGALDHDGAGQRARAAAAWSVTVGAQQVTMPGAEGAKAACEGRGHLEGGEVARDRDWHGPSHHKRAWLKASTAILPLSPSFLCVAPR